MATLERLRVYPLKAFDGHELETVQVLPGGTLAHDREFALSDDEGAVLNGKRTAGVHTVRTSYDPAVPALTVTTDEESRTFDLETDQSALEAWFSDHFELDLHLERDQQRGFVDRRTMGPSVVSTATLEAIASWFDDLDVHGVRRRLRANIEIGGVPAFWEDHILGTDAPTLQVGDVRLEGVEPCGRCVVPERDPDTGEPLEDFREHFVHKREETFPSWADPVAFDHHYAVMVIAAVPEADRGTTLQVGDPVGLSE